MKVINGKHNLVRIMIDEVEDTALEQIQGIADNPAMKNSNIVIMPDCHAGKGCVIGFTQEISKNDYIIPNLIGVDIGCGVLSMKLGKINIDLQRLDQFIKSNIPHGFAHRKKPHPGASELKFKPIANVADEEDVKCQVGTLGGGNHFIEIGIDSNNDKWLFIHSGSRNYGNKIATFYQNKAKEICDNDRINIPRGTEFLHKSNKYYSEYYHDLKSAQDMAELNRSVIAYEIINHFGLETCNVFNFDTVHNYIENNIVRKGAISAVKDKLCAIPFNMRDGVAICKGKGSKEWNYSAPHGAGRILSRKKARKAISSEKVKLEMAANNIFSTTAHLAVDEAPQAYKDMETIINAMSETVEIIDFVKPIYNFKSY